MSKGYELWTIRRDWNQDLVEFYNAFYAERLARLGLEYHCMSDGGMAGSMQFVTTVASRSKSRRAFFVQLISERSIHWVDVGSFQPVAVAEALNETDTVSLGLEELRWIIQMENMTVDDQAVRRAVLRSHLSDEQQASFLLNNWRTIKKLLGDENVDSTLKRRNQLHEEYHKLDDTGWDSYKEPPTTRRQGRGRQSVSPVNISTPCWDDLFRYCRKHYAERLKQHNFEFCEKSDGPGRKAAVKYCLRRKIGRSCDFPLFLKIVNDNGVYHQIVTSNSCITRGQRDFPLRTVYWLLRLEEEKINRCDKGRRQEILTDNLSPSKKADFFFENIDRILELFSSENFAATRRKLQSLSRERTKTLA